MGKVTNVDRLIDNYIEASSDLDELHKHSRRSTKFMFASSITCIVASLVSLGSMSISLSLISSVIIVSNIVYQLYSIRRFREFSKYCRWAHSHYKKVSDRLDCVELNEKQAGRMAAYFIRSDPEMVAKALDSDDNK